MTNGIGTKLRPTYAYDLAFPLIDYCGDIGKSTNKDSGSITYHDNFSPNNIKRIIISPDGVDVYYFVAIDAKGTRKEGHKNFSAQTIAQIQNLEDYVPAIEVLYKQRVCASIQEIIIVKYSDFNRSISLTARELALESLVGNYKGKTGDLIETIGKRYKRLACISIFNGTRNELKALVRNIKGNTGILVDDEQIASKCQTTNIHREDWFMNYGFTSFYALDADGSRLNNYFKKVKETKLKLAEQKKIEDFKKEKAGKLSSSVKADFEKAANNYGYIATCVGKLSILLNKYSNSKCIVAPTYLSSLRNALNIELLESYLVDDFKKTAGKVVQSCITLTRVTDNANENDIVRQNTVKLNTAATNIYNEVLKMFFMELDATGNAYGGITLKVMLNSFDRVIAVPNSLASYNSKLAELGCEFTGTRVKDSIANLCYLYSVFYISNRTDTDTMQYMSKEYWLEAYNGNIEKRAMSLS